MKKISISLITAGFFTGGLLLILWGLLSKPEPVKTFQAQQVSITVIRLHNDFWWKFFIMAGVILIIISIMFLGYFYMRRTKNLKTGLTAREKEILNLILEGKSNKEIASALFISPSTVKTHIHNIFKKMSVSSRDELIQK